ncbi:Protein takeout [Gryllus bimaculatus]|nr:Protein takeout [Gryllus bimaculatus]
MELTGRPRGAPPLPALALAIALGFALAAPADAAIKLPSYIKTCSRNDPNLNECALKNGKAAIPYLLPGDPKIKLPSLNPLRVQEIRVDQEGSVGLNLLLRDLDIVGLGDGDLRSVRFDPKQLVLDVHLFVPRLQLLGKYNISGRILIIPIHGKGDANITLDNVPLNYTLRFAMETRKGKEYLKVVDKNIEFDASQAHFTFENLFDGDERLRANVRRVVNENWRQVIEDIGPPVVSAIGEVVTQLLKGFVSAVPYDELFPDTPA